MDPDGTNIQKVFEETAHRTHPAYAPDGKRIAYLKNTEHAIYTATITGEEENRLVQVGKNDSDPVWSPDGSDRQWTCHECGSNHDRDVNAALNIKRAGLAA